MIIPDINLLVYAYNEDAPDHTTARRWWEDIVNGTESVELPWIVSAGFVRVSTNSHVMPRPLEPSVAVDLVWNWLERDHVLPLNPSTEHIELFRRNLVATGVGRNLVTDAHIVALALEYDVEVHSNDSDFGRFPGLRWLNPLQQSTTAQTQD